MTAISRALQALAPLSCAVTDARGKPVALRTSGYVLRPGRSYRVQVRWPFPDADIERVFLAAPPEFIRADPGNQTFDAQGQSVWSVPFSVRRGGSALWERLLVRADDLSLECAFRPGTKREAAPYRCPVVVRPLWIVLVCLVLLSLSAVMVPAFIQRFVVKQAAGSGGVERFASELISDPSTIALFSAVLLWAGVVIGFIHFAQTTRRRRELRRQFNQKYDWDGPRERPRGPGG